MTTPSPLRSRDFRLLVGGVAVSGLGSAMTPVALAFAVLDLGGTATQLGLVVAAFSAAEVITILYGGVLGDRLPRQLLMQGSSAATAVSQAACAAVLITGHGSLWFLTAIGVVNGCLGAVAQPASNAMTRSTVTDEQLGRAVVLRSLANQTAFAVGFAIAGVIVAVTSPGWAIAVDAVTYAVAAVLFAMIRVPASATAGRERLLAELADGAREVFRHTWLWLLIGQALLYHLCFGGVQGVLGPIVVSDTWSKEAWGWTLSALMAGFVAGGLVALRWRPRHLLRWGVVMLAFTAAFPLALAVAGDLSVVLVGAFVHGVGLQLFSVSWDLAIQENIAEDMLARVYSFDTVGSYVCRPLGLALTGPVAAVVGTDRWLVAVAAVIGLSSIAALGAPSVRQLTRRTTPVSVTPEPART
ncbi:MULTISPECIES: MFS transporter [unclassified Nocardioides]|uniref:MFS transporter n=1 Tax=unclassified Nocardioides TaxID=2615069 RepID=UPI00117291BE|nr:MULTISPECIES: MFS transporter [unclassified Nocardioides]TQK68359.1 MFS transporter [Nocardioides sp. SLBN-35]WGY02327.1 MFS transporter [Nocardioides sp. QY071]